MTGPSRRAFVGAVAAPGCARRIAHRAALQPRGGARHAKGQGAERFRQLADERSKGHLKVEVWPNSELSRDKGRAGGAAAGQRPQMLAPSLASSGRWGEEFEVFDLPYLFGTRPRSAPHRRPVRRDLLRRLEARGIRGLAYWDNGFEGDEANRPLHSVADFGA